MRCLRKRRDMKRSRSPTKHDHSENSGTDHHHHHEHHRPHQCKRCGHMKAASLETRRVCKYCNKEMARQCIYEHQRFHCPKSPHRTKRTFTKKKCEVCGKMAHEKSIARHRRSHSKDNKAAKVTKTTKGKDTKNTKDTRERETRYKVVSSNLLACSNGWSSASVGFCQEAQGSHGGLVGGLSGNTKEAREFVWRRDFCARQCAHICGQGKVLVSRCSKNPWVMICGCLELAHIARISPSFCVSVPCECKEM